MKLNKILENCSSKFTRNNDKNVNIKGISTNSTEMRNNYIFGAIKGKNFNGENFMREYKKNKILDKKLIKNLAPNIAEGVDKLKKWSESL